MKVLLKSIITTAVILAFFPGCSNMTMLRTQELRNVQTKIDSLATVMVGLQNKIADEQKVQGEMIRLLRADQQIRFNEINQKVVAIDGSLSENQVRLTKIDEKTAQVQKKIEAKLSADSANENNKSSETEKFFQIAMSDFYAGRFDLAINSFNDIALQNQGQPIGQDAEYWIAECSYAKKVYVDAEKSYVGYIKKYPQGSKICVVYYKLGLVYEKQNRDKARNMVWKKLIEQCPDSQEAKVIQSQMRQ